MTKQMSDGQRNYEAKRAARAGVSLDTWLKMKEREQQDAERARVKAVAPPRPAKRGLFSRLIDRAHKPL